MSHGRHLQRHLININVNSTYQLNDAIESESNILHFIVISMSVPYFHSKWDSCKTPIKTSYLVVTLPRSKSNLLCYSLIENGNAGIPLEYFHESSSETQDFYRDSLKTPFNYLHC